MHFFHAALGGRGPWEIRSLPGGDDYRIAAAPIGALYTPEAYPWEGQRCMESITFWCFSNTVHQADPHVVEGLLEIHRCVRPSAHGVHVEVLLREPEHREYLQGIAQELRDAVRSGQLRVDLLPRKYIAHQRDKLPSERPATQQAEDWIGIRIVDHEGRPIPGVKYRVKLPSGAVVAEGEVDAQGRAHIDGLSPGQCSIECHALDGRTWTLRSGS